jgi:hypothetical protein
VNVDEKASKENRLYRLMSSGKVNEAATSRSGLSALWLAVYWIVALFVALLMVETTFRIKFPWDLYLWSESP